MKQTAYILLFLIWMVQPLETRAEYRDHRNRGVDSLEQVLKTRRLEGEELFRVYDGLMNGYLQTDADKSSHYAKLAIELAEKNRLWSGLNTAWRVLGLQAYGSCNYDSAQHCFDRALKATERMKGDKRYTQEDFDDNLSALYGTWATCTIFRASCIWRWTITRRRCPSSSATDGRRVSPSCSTT